MKTYRVKFHHADPGLGKTIFKVVDEERYFNRIDGDGWYTVYPSYGYWESCAFVRDDITFEVVNKDGNVVFIESNATLCSF